MAFVCEPWTDGFVNPPLHPLFAEAGEGAVGYPPYCILPIRGGVCLCNDDCRLRGPRILGSKKPPSSEAMSLS